MNKKVEVVLQELEATFSFEKETTNTYRFQEDEEKGKLPISGTMYLQKIWFDEKPNKIRVLVKVLENNGENNNELDELTL
ncbi:MAG: hypothetical protein ACTSPO_14925 [Candidatus Heimdallarchaeaceae archaeon]